MPQNRKISQRRSLLDQKRSLGFRSMPSTESESRRPPIPVSRKSGRHAIGTGGRHGPERVVGIRRIRWSAWPGLRTRQVKLETLGQGLTRLGGQAAP